MTALMRDGSVLAQRGLTDSSGERPTFLAVPFNLVFKVVWAKAEEIQMLRYEVKLISEVIIIPKGNVAAQ
jgi:hypothetical protein